MRFLPLALPAVLLVQLTSAWSQSTPAVERKELYPTTSEVKLRVLTKPFSKIYENNAATDDKVRETPPAFSVFYVIQPPSGTSKRVYQIADSTGLSKGYMKEEDVVPWKQALCLQFEHSGNRNPVLMFDSKETLRQIVTSEEGRRRSQASDYYSVIAGLGKDAVLPENFPVVSMEPRRMMENSAATYLMPIVDFEDGVEMGDNDVRLLQVAIAASKATPRGTTDKKDTKYMQSANQATNAADASNAPVEIIYCFDLTGSMQKYVDICTSVAEQVSQALVQTPGLRERVKFGLWGYQDHDPGREFVVHNFTPQMVSVENLKSALSQAKASKVNAGDIPEDMLHGVNSALQQGWTGDAQQTIRVMVVFGDAPGHDSPADPNNGSRMGISQIRSSANAAHVYIYAIHIMDPDPKSAPFHSQAEYQFRELTTNSGLTATTAAYWPVRGDNAQNFAPAAQSLYNGLNNAIGNADQLLREAEKRKEDGPVPTEELTPNIIANDLFAAALVDWIGRNSKDAQIPNDITAWISERDLINGEPSIKPTVLLSKTQLDQLTTSLELILEAGLAGRSSGRDFFSSLQSVAVTAVTDPNKLMKATVLKDSGLIPDFIQGLPYKSRLADLSSELWISWPSTQQEKFLEDVQNMITHYKEIHNTPNRWTDLDGQGGGDDMVASIPLDQLP